MRKDGLLDKQRLFCQEYIKDLNATAAAVRAGYSKKTANEGAAQLMAKPSIKAEIKRLQKKISDKNDDLAQRVIDELIKVGFSNVQDYITTDNSIEDLSAIDKAKAAAIAGIKKTVTSIGSGEAGLILKEVTEFKLWDKVEALEKIGKHLGIFEKDNSQKAPQIITVTDTDD